MRSRALSPLVALSITIVAFAACAETPDASTAPIGVAREAQRLQGADEPVASVGSSLVAPLSRTTALSEPVSWSFTVDSSGATSTNSATGLTITVPRGAVSDNVTITVTALAGSAVAYRFEPHGLTFARKVHLTQSLAGTNVGLLSGLLLQGAHFEGDAPVLIDGLALVTETVNASIDVLANSTTFPIQHFSGWIVASGRSEDGGGQ